MFQLLKRLPKWRQQFFVYIQKFVAVYEIPFGNSGVATGGKSAPPDSEKNAKNREREGEKKKRGKIRKRKSVRFFHFVPDR